MAINYSGIQTPLLKNKEGVFGGRYRHTRPFQPPLLGQKKRTAVQQSFSYIALVDYASKAKRL